jgi:hypothetical protein
VTLIGNMDSPLTPHGPFGAACYARGTGLVSYASKAYCSPYNHYATALMRLIGMLCVK